MLDKYRKEIFPNPNFYLKYNSYTMHCENPFLIDLSPSIDPQKRAVILLSIPYQMLEQGDLTKKNFDLIYTTLSFAVGAGNTGFPALTKKEIETADYIKRRVRTLSDSKGQADYFLENLKGLQTRFPEDRQRYFEDCVKYIEKLLKS